MIARMGCSGALARAVYATCLDVSFGRTGGCIAVVDSDRKARVRRYVSNEDILASATADKAKLIRHLVGRPFTQIPRSIREELAALDGAIVLGNEGEVLSAGAIVSVPGGSDGGGRKAAAKALSRLGLAIKISADGGITAYTKLGPDAQPEIAFEICV
jgi:DNA integrity scanning protein DisA with diadenylate cyclase activity